MSKGTDDFWQQTGWFFDLYAKLIRDPDSVSSILDEKVAGLASGESAIETGLTLFLVALYGQKSGDMELIRGVRVSDACDQIVRALERATSPFSPDPREVWVLALWAGALRNINLFLKRDDIARVLGGLKNYVYANAIFGNVLVSSTDRKTLGYDVLFCSVPMGLFEPEDLVLVEAVKKLGAPKRIQQASGKEKLLLAWYYCEQGA
ncbi:hypothetical protein MNBD_ALPHA12-1308, partial [hydrothermal vent metagenome]